jgi:erythrocyte band 7 integral membrane protein
MDANDSSYSKSADMGKAQQHSFEDGHDPLNDPLVKVQPPKRSELQPSYASVIKPDTADDEGSSDWYGSMINTLGTLVGTLGAIPCCICLPNPYKAVDQGSVGLVTKFGRFTRAVDPGLVRINPLSEKLVQIDVKIQIVGKYKTQRNLCSTQADDTLNRNP